MRAHSQRLEHVDAQLGVSGANQFERLVLVASVRHDLAVLQVVVSRRRRQPRRLELRAQCLQRQRVCCVMVLSRLIGELRYGPWHFALRSIGVWPRRLAAQAGRYLRSASHTKNARIAGPESKFAENS